MIDRSNHENQKYNYKGRDTLDVLQFCDGTTQLKKSQNILKSILNKLAKY